MRKLFFAILTLFTLAIFSGCTSSSSQQGQFVKSIFQTNGASSIVKHTSSLTKSLLKYSSKLNKRNPSYYSKKYAQIIKQDIKKNVNTIRLPLIKNSSNSYEEYLTIAFSKNYVKNRNDYLILGIYKMLYFTYDRDRGHTVTTMQYEIEKLQEANKLLQVIRYKINNAKDKNGNYLFITWQRKWQIDLLKNINSSKKMTKLSLNKKNTKLLLERSNMSYQVILSDMIFTVQKSIIVLGGEVNNLGAQTIKTFIFFI
ncbi:MAG: hypothetical protein GQ570_07190 [Helicobacteraceae bacterium]|nr:hypothetical protein [Helicobacteraceae bacterium]